MSKKFVQTMHLPELPLWEKMYKNRKLISFDLELTARCNLNCRHCYINLPAGDRAARELELSLNELKNIVDEAVSLGAVWCLITGGEPILREDFFDVYLYLKKKGLLLSIFTNATLIKDAHIKLFKKYPPREMEVTVYGVTQNTYEKVSRKPGSFQAFLRGLNLLLENGTHVRLKAMALRSNANELQEIASFCRDRTKDYFRFDPFLHLRYDKDKIRNREIRAERLSPEEIVAIEQSDPERFSAMQKHCDKLIVQEFRNVDCGHLFRCGAGVRSFTLGADGSFRLCSSLWHPNCVYDLRQGNLSDAWINFVAKVREMRSEKKEFLERCNTCPLVNLCLWCAAHSDLECGELDRPVDYFCQVAHAREEALRKT